MDKTIYEDYKYCMQDVGTIYLGAKYTFDEIVNNEMILFKLRLIVERYIMPEADGSDTLESHLYYLEPDSKLMKVYKQMKAKIKINVIEEKKGITGQMKKQYVTRSLTAEQLSRMPVQEKEAKGVVVQELAVSKLSLLSF